MNLSFRLCASLMALGLVAVAQTAPKPKAAAAAQPAATPAAPVTPRPDGLYATIVTSMGPITLQLFEKEAPITVKNFMGLATGGKAWTNPKTHARTTKPLYPGTTFHRVIPGFMIQGGDPLGTGMGSTDVIKDEFDPSLKFDRPGRLAMANAGLGTGSCQFFITEAPTPHLDGKHTIFGQVVENQDLVAKIARVPKNAEDKPSTPVVIQKITFERWADGKPAPVKPAATRPATKAGTKAGAATKKAPATTKK